MKDRFGWPEPLADLIDGFNRRFPTHFRCDVEVQEALTRARETGWSIGIVTNGGPIQADKITHADLAPLVDAGCCISSVDEFAKPIVAFGPCRDEVRIESRWGMVDRR